MKSIQLPSHVESQVVGGGGGGRRTGLLLGQAGGDSARTLVLAAVPTPPRPSGAAARDWFAQHARQVRRMLVGGVELVGCYVRDSEAGLAAGPETDAALRDLAFALPLPTATAASADRLVLKATPKLSCDVYSGGSRRDGQKASKATVKVAPLGGPLIRLSATVALDLAFAVTPNDAGTHLRAQVQQALDSYHARVASAAFVVDGKSLESSLVLEKALDSSAPRAKGKSDKSRGKSSSKKSTEADSDDADATHEVEFFLRPPAPLPTVENAAGIIRLRGACQCRAYAHSKSTVGQAIALLCEEFEETSGVDFGLPSSSGPGSYSWHFPRRVFAPLSNGGVGGDICDYILAFETERDAAARMEEMIGLVADETNLPQTNEQCATDEPKTAEAANDAIERFLAQTTTTNTNHTNDTTSAAAAAPTTAASSSADKTASSSTPSATATKSAGGLETPVLLAGLGVTALAVTFAFLQLM